jgi:hypothetical protein
MLVRLNLRDILMCLQSENLSESTMKWHYISDDESFDLDYIEPKQPRIDIDDWSVEENESLFITENNDKQTRYPSKNRDNYKWKSEHLITFPWLEYDSERSIAKCRLIGCKMYMFNFSYLIF